MPSRCRMIPCAGDSPAHPGLQTLQSACPPGDSVIRLPAVLALLAAASAHAAPPDRIFFNGRIWTGDPARPRATALAVQGDVLAAVGSDAEVRSLAGARTRVVDLKGRFVAPGFNDAHIPFLVVETVDLGEDQTVAAIQKRIRDYAAANRQ